MPDMIDCFKHINTLQRRGISSSSALQEFNRVTNLSYRYNEAISITESIDWGAGFVLEKNGRQSFVSLNRMDAIDMFLYRATEKILRNQPDVDQKQLYYNFSKPVKSTVDISTDRPHVQDLGVEILKKIGSEVITHDPSFRFNCQLELVQVSKMFQSSNFQDVSQKFNRDVLSIEVFSLNSPHHYRLKTVIGGLVGECFDWVIIDERLSKLLSDYSSMLNSSPPVPGKYPVILHPDASFSLIHETIGHAVEADQVVSGNSFLSDSIGYPIGSPLLNITDDPNIKTNGWFYYDDEGVKSQGTQLVEEGILMNFLHSKATASALGVSSTGNARSSSYSSPPEPRQSNLFVEPGDVSLEDMLTDMKSGLVIGPTDIASTSIYSGEYIINSQINYKVENGEITQVLGPCQIVDHSMITLNNVINLSRETEKIPSECLKNNSKVHIGGITPYMQIKQVMIR